MGSARDRLAATIGVSHELQHLVRRQGGAEVRLRREIDDCLEARGQRGEDHDGAVVRREASGCCFKQNGQQRMHEGIRPQALDRRLGSRSATGTSP